jgi:predicted AlkP superfamily phosphohydrolase/phosphomutase
MDPVLTERWMSEGGLPNFAALAKAGHYQRLATTNPPQSPVAWASFATGLDPGGHGIFDFLRRDEHTYAPDFSIAEQIPSQRTLDLFGWQLPLDSGSVRNRRDGEPFWIAVEREGQHASVLRVPVTYPPDAITRMLSGMGVPDLLGTQGTYTLYATRRIPGAENGGRVELVGIGDDGVLRADFKGPPHPLKSSASPLSVPLQLEAKGDGARLTLDGHEVDLAVGRWSDWIRLRFRFAGFASVEGMVRANLQQGFPRPLLYLSPINIDPLAPAVPISAPADYAQRLAATIGDYHTLGMPEETWALNQGHLDERAWLDMVKITLAEGEAMLRDTLARNDSELVVKVFVQTDRVSHMFWRGIDEEHPLHAASSELARGAIPWIYREADRILGDVRGQLRPDDRLVVLSDHGFASFRRAVHLNRWLADEGYLALKKDVDSSAPLFASVDWSRTRAYALGLNGIFVNLKGREMQGIVEAQDVAALKAALRERLPMLRDPADDGTVVHTLYDADALYHGAHRAEAPDLVVGYASGYRASWQTSLGAVPAAILEDNLQPWSGDHCIDPEAVPGVLFTSFDPAETVVGIGDLAGLARRQLARPDKE